MATTITKTPRLLAAATEFNIGKDTLVEFLVDKGFEINSNPNTKLTEQMYNALQVEFAQDKLAKRRSEDIVLAKGSLMDNLKKTKEDLDLNAKDRKDDHHTAEIKPKTKEPEKPIIEPEKAKPVAAVKEEPAKPVVQAPPKVEIPVKKAEVEQAPPPPPPLKIDAPVEKPVIALQEEAPILPAKKTVIKEVEPVEVPEHLDMKAPKIEGPNILGKINLDDMNLASRPKKGAAKKKEIPKKDAAKKEVKSEDAELKPAKPATAKPKKDVHEEKVPKRPEVIIPEIAAPEEETPGKPEHIEMKAPKLEGPKIIGRIELNYPYHNLQVVVITALTTVRITGKNANANGYL